MNVEVTGPNIVWSFPFGIHITETVINTWAAMAVVLLVCIFLTKNLKVRNPGKRQLIAEWLYHVLVLTVKDTSCRRDNFFVTYIATLFAMSLTCSLMSLIGLRPPTADLSVTLVFAVISFVLTQTAKIKRYGITGYFKSFTKPSPLIMPLNLISEIATPVSMAFRHFGNIASGVIISALVYGTLISASKGVFGGFSNPFVASVPWLATGIPAVLSLYFDVFTAFLQAYIICMLTMVFAADSESVE